MIHHGDCLAILPTLEAESVDAIVTDPPYGLEFMGKAWDRLGDIGQSSHAGPDKRSLGSRYGNGITYSASSNVKCRACGKWAWTQADKKCVCEFPDFPNVRAHQGRLMGEWHARWAEAAYRVAKPGAYLLAFGGTRTVHRMTCAIEDAGWIIRDMLVWAYASGFPKGRANLKPAWEPIVMARKPGPLRPLNIDECRIPIDADDRWAQGVTFVNSSQWAPGSPADRGDVAAAASPLGRWPANVILTDPVFDGGWDGVVGGGETTSPTEARPLRRGATTGSGMGYGSTSRTDSVGSTYSDQGTYSRFFLVPKAARSDREPVLGGLSGVEVDERIHAFDDFNTNTVAARRRNSHPTVKPTDLMRHLVRLVTPQGGTVLDPFLGSGTTALAAEMEGFAWVGIEREAEYVAIAEARLNGTQRGMAL